jgi:hypothetical protein
MRHWGGNLSPHFVWVWSLDLTQAYISGFLVLDRRILGNYLWGSCGTLLKEQGSYILVQNMGHKGSVVRPRCIRPGGLEPKYYSIYPSFIKDGHCSTDWRIPLTAAVFCYYALVLANKDGRDSPVVFIKVLFVCLCYPSARDSWVPYLCGVLYAQCFKYVFFWGIVKWTYSGEVILLHQHVLSPVLPNWLWQRNRFSATTAKLLGHDLLAVLSS